MADQNFIREALERFSDCEQATSVLYKELKDDLAFVEGRGQWDDGMRRMRENDKRPCLVENRVSGMAHQVCNDLRQNRPGIEVVPRDPQATDENAEILKGFLGFLQYDSDSAAAIDTAVENQVRGGIGYVRVLTEYEEEDGFEQVIRFGRIKDSTSVLFPVHLCNDALFKDAPFCFVFTDMPKDLFNALYPKAETVPFTNDSRNSWVTDKTVRVAEYFVKEQTARTLFLLPDGSKAFDDELPAEISRTGLVSRRIVSTTIKWYKLMATRILEQGVIPGKFFPIVPFLGDEFWLDGELVLKSLTRDARDPQRMLNYWRSVSAERIALAPRSPWVMYEGQDEGFEHEWLQAHIRNIPVLHAKIKSENGDLLPLPRREAPLSADTALVSAAAEAVDAIKATTGIYDAALGNRSNERSGKAIVARQRESDTANYHFADNVARALRQLGRVVLAMVPSVYDTQRVLRILGKDRVEKTVLVNEELPAGGKKYDLTIGCYDAVVEAGPSYASRRQEALINITELGQNDPQLITGMRDLLLKYMNLPAEVVERARRMVPPELLDENEQMTPQVLQAQIQQYQGLIKQLDTAIQELTKENEKLQLQVTNKAGDQQVRLQIADLQAQVDLAIARLKAAVEDARMSHELGLKAAEHAGKNHSQKNEE